MEQLESKLRALDTSQKSSPAPEWPPHCHTFTRLYIANLGYPASNGVPIGRCRKFLKQAVPLHTLAWIAIEKDPQMPFNSTQRVLLDSIMKNRANANVVLADPLLRLEHFNNVMPVQFTDRSRAAQTLLDLWSKGLDLYFPENEPATEI